MSKTAVENMVKDNYQNHFNEYLNHEKEAVKLQHCVGQLLYNKGIELVLFRNTMTDAGISELLQLHEYANSVVKRPITVKNSAALAEEQL